MTETELREHRALPWWFIVALVFSLILNAVIVVWFINRADTAETSALSLAEQVQTACDTQGSLDLAGRDLCDDADTIVEGTPIAGPAGAQGEPGPAGPEGPPGVAGPQGRTGPPGETGPPGPMGRTGAAGTDGEPGSVGATGATGASGEQGEPGPAGPQGEPGATGATGEQGEQGATGPAGTAKPGTYDCPVGQYVTGFTVTQDGGVDLACSAFTPGP